MVSVAGFRTSETPSARSIFLGDAVFEKESLFQNLQILPVKAKPVLAWVEHEVSKSKGKQVGESKGQDIKPMARDRNSRNWIYFLAVKCYPVAQGSFDHQCREMGTSEMELSRTVQVSTGDEMNCRVLGHIFFPFLWEREYSNFFTYLSCRTIPSTSQCCSNMQITFPPFLLIAKC